jgi:hypothetical protein
VRNEQRRYALRAFIVNFNTGIDDVRALREIVIRPGRRAAAPLCAGGLPND